MKRILLIIILFCAANLKSEPDGKIYSVLNPNDTLIHLGPCYISDSLQTDIFMGNTGDTDLFMDGQSPSLVIYASPNQQSTLEFNQFNRIYPGMTPSNPFVLQTGINDLFGVEYKPSNPLINPLGINEANIQIALLSVDDASIVEMKTFLLRVNKTDQFLAGFETKVDFDSVYVNPSSTKVFNWKVKSTWVNNIIVTNQRLLAQNIQEKGEVRVNETEYPLQFEDKYATMEWTIQYSPKDLGRDSSEFSLLFKPDEINFPDSTSEVTLDIFGFGVEQKIEINDSNYDFVRDTINIGDVIIGKEQNISAIIQNIGNININSLGEVILEEFNDVPYTRSQIISSLQANGELKVDSTSEIEFDFIPTKYGHFIYRYSISTDIKNRGIFGVPPSAEKLELFIKGRGVSPRLTAETDTLDFNNIILNSIDCPSERDTVLRISNNGNLTLRITDIFTEPPFPQSKFRVNPNEMILGPGKDTSISITFVSNDAVVDEYKEKLVMITNQYPPDDSIRVDLLARTIPPVEAYLSVPRNIAAKPGNSIKIPILIENEDGFPSTYATNFHTNLSYNPTILTYKSYGKLETASENSIIEIADDSTGLMRIDLTDNDFFNPSDTLIVLEFDVYMGNSPSSDIVLNTPVFGDNNCSKIMNTIVYSGNVILDSVCGIEYKAIPFSDSKISFNLFESKYNTANIIYEIPYKSTVGLEIYDVYGNLSNSFIFGNKAKGIYEDVIDLNSLSSGVYFFRFRFDRYYLNKKILIGK